jgi:uncharacterized membrane protein YphA (DoxX/SURF4 family)
MTLPSFRRPLPVTLRVLVSLGFLAAALTKFLPHSGWQTRFAAWGYPAWFVPLVGGLEVLGVAGLWVPRVSRQAIVLLAVVLIEATYTNLSHPPTMQAIRPGVFLTLLTALFLAQQFALPRVGTVER